MEKRTKDVFICEICGEEFDRESSCAECESRPLIKDFGVKIGDVVKITAGEGEGKLAKVKRILTHPLRWGGHKYWHTVSLDADVIGSWGTRLLTWDNYELV